MKRSLLIALGMVLVAGLSLTACTQPAAEPTAEPTPMVEPTVEMPIEEPTEPVMLGDILTVLEEEGTFTTLLSLIGTAGLTETLAGPGPFTLFAPDDAAFAALPEGTLDDLLPEDVTAILLGHVLPMKVMAADIAGAPDMTLEEATVQEGTTLTAVSDGMDITVNDLAVVVQPDIEASNGVIHVIDVVLLPEAEEME